MSKQRKRRKVKTKRMTAEEMCIILDNAINPGEDYKPTRHEWCVYLAEQVNDFFGAA
jgi:hypothetical protein